MKARAGAGELIDNGQSVRQLGMGGVYIFNSQDAMSFLQNPGYLCHTKGLNATLLNFGLGATGDTQFYNNVSSIGNFQGPEDLAPFYGQNVWVGFGGQSTVTLPCFGISAWDYGFAKFILHNPAYPTMNFSYLNDYAFQIGGGFMINQFLSFGLSLKRVNRRAQDIILDPQSLLDIDSSTLSDSIQNQGIGYGIDMGIAARYDNLPFSPTFTAVWKDVGSTAFIKEGGTDSPSRQKDNVIFGANFEGDIPMMGFSFGGEYRHVRDDGEAIGKKIHLGAELNLLMFDFRAGLYQGYPTYGLGLDLWLIQMDLAYYTVERGAYPGQTPDQRIQIGLNVDLSFDPSFKLTDIGGKRRKLKQRR